MPPTDAAEVAFHYYPAASVASSQLPASELLEHMDGGGVAAFLSERRSDGWRWLRPSFSTQPAPMRAHLVMRDKAGKKGQLLRPWASS